MPPCERLHDGNMNIASAMFSGFRDIGTTVLHNQPPPKRRFHYLAGHCVQRYPLLGEGNLLASSENLDSFAMSFGLQVP